MRLNILAFAAGILAAVTISLPAFGQAYPSRPLRMVVPFPPGGTPDMLSRLLAQRATQILGQQVIVDNMDICVAGGVESISCVQQEVNQHMAVDPELKAMKPEIYWNMLQTAETVAKRYGISRLAQDEYGARSQQRAFAAQEAGKFNDEIVPITVGDTVVDRDEHLKGVFRSISCWSTRSRLKSAR